MYLLGVPYVYLQGEVDIYEGYTAALRSSLTVDDIVVLHLMGESASSLLSNHTAITVAIHCSI